MTTQVLIIPTSPGSAQFLQTTQLSGVRYEFAFQWVQRWQRWIVSVSLEDGTELINGIPLLSYIDIFRNHRHLTSAPPGVVCAWDATGSGRDPGLFTLDPDGAFPLVYIVDSELA